MHHNYYLVQWMNGWIDFNKRYEAPVMMLIFVFLIDSTAIVNENLFATLQK